GEISKKFFRMQQEMRKEHALGQSREYEGTYIDASKEREKLIERLRFFERMKATLSPKDYEQFKEKIRGSRMYEFIPPETVDPIDYLKQALEDNERRIGYGREIALSGLKEAYQIEEAIKNAKTLKEYGLDRTAASLADLAKFAIDKEKAKKLKEPLYVSPEAYDPEMYGGHPDEMREIVQAARKKFVERHKGEYGEKKAKELAESHIKATFDIGHAYTWKKYFQGSEKDFHKWIDKKVTGLLKDGIIGHVHVSDNFGYDDEHLTPGEGIIGKERLRSFVEKLKKYGIKDLIVEAGGQPGGEGWRAMLGGWDVFGSPIYGAERASWSDVHHSYFGRANAPMYVFGEYAPSNEFRGAPFWSGLGLE
ncbi:hypothetical protein KY337_00275, partial [Candidatus Woesearchaeota archaeon]|nr:hypothetical protein [Candidatus Woesearchaeota archaeon]